MTRRGQATRPQAFLPLGLLSLALSGGCTSGEKGSPQLDHRTTRVYQAAESSWEHWSATGDFDQLTQRFSLSLEAERAPATQLSLVASQAPGQAILGESLAAAARTLGLEASYKRQTLSLSGASDPALASAELGLLLLPTGEADGALLGSATSRHEHRDWTIALYGAELHRSGPHLALAGHRKQERPQVPPDSLLPDDATTARIEEDQQVSVEGIDGLGQLEVSAGAEARLAPLPQLCAQVARHSSTAIELHGPSDEHLFISSTGPIPVLAALRALELAAPYLGLEAARGEDLLLLLPAEAGEQALPELIGVWLFPRGSELLGASFTPDQFLRMLQMQQSFGLPGLQDFELQEETGTVIGLMLEASAEPVEEIDEEERLREERRARIAERTERMRAERSGASAETDLPTSRQQAGVELDGDQVKAPRSALEPLLQPQELFDRFRLQASPAPAWTAGYELSFSSRRTSPLQLLGLQAGDVLLALNGEPTCEREHVSALLRALLRDPRVELTILRGAEERRLSITIHGEALALPEGWTLARLVPASAADLGIEAQDDRYALPKTALQYLFASDDNLPVRATPHKGSDGEIDGLRLSAIRRDSSLHLLGIKNGDIVHSCNGQALHQSLTPFPEAMRAGGTITLKLTRRNARRTLIYEVGER